MKEEARGSESRPAWTPQRNPVSKTKQGKEKEPKQSLTKILNNKVL